jgi:hypothetical protein
MRIGCQAISLDSIFRVKWLWIFRVREILDDEFEGDFRVREKKAT